MGYTQVCFNTVGTDIAEYQLNRVTHDRPGWVQVGQVEACYTGLQVGQTEECYVGLQVSSGAEPAASL